MHLNAHDWRKIIVIPHVRESTDQHMSDFKRDLVAANQDCDLSYRKFAGCVRRYLMTMCRIWIRLGQKDHT